MMTYLDLLKYYFNLELDATDPMDYTTIIWEIQKQELVFNDGMEEYITIKEEIEPIPESVILDLYKNDLINDLQAQTESDIINGFESDALGTMHHYDASLENQINLIGAVMANIDVYYSCTDQNGVKEMRLHTPEQIKQVFNDGVMFKQMKISEMYQKRDSIKNASTLNELVALL